MDFKNTVACKFALVTQGKKTTLCFIFQLFINVHLVNYMLIKINYRPCTSDFDG